MSAPRQIHHHRRRRVLFLTSDFPPAFRGGGMRVLSFARYLPEFGWDATVLTAHPAPAVARDPSLLKLLPDNADVVRVPSPRLFLPGVALSRLGLREPGRMLLELGQIPDEHAGWLVPAVLAGVRLLSRGHFHAILVSGGSWAGFLAARFLGARSGLPVILDYRDQWTGNRGKSTCDARHRVGARLERWCLLGASGIAVTTPAYLPVIQRACLPAFSRLHKLVLRNGFSQEDFAAPKSSVPEDSTGCARGVFEVRCIGRQGPTGNPDAFFRALALFHARNPRARLRTRFIGERMDAYLRLPERHGVADLVSWEPFVPHAEAVALMRGADALLEILVTAPGDVAPTPARIYEYLRSGRPVLCVSSPGDTARLVEKHHAGIVSDPSSPECIADALENLYRAWESGKPATGAPAGSLNDYERRALVERLGGLLDACTRGMGG